RCRRRFFPVAALAHGKPEHPAPERLRAGAGTSCRSTARAARVLGPRVTRAGATRRARGTARRCSETSSIGCDCDETEENDTRVEANEIETEYLRENAPLCALRSAGGGGLRSREPDAGFGCERRNRRQESRGRDRRRTGRVECGRQPGSRRERRDGRGR